MFSPFGDRSRRHSARRRARRLSGVGGFHLEPLERRQLLASDTTSPLADPSPHVVRGPPGQHQDVVLIDSTLLASIPQEELAGSLIFAVDGDRDAIDQITTALAGLSQVDVVRVISHGSDGSLWFGSQRIDAATLEARAADVSGWGRSLSAGADILLYGCSVASTLDGQLFVKQIGLLTQADIAASNDTTGSGGDVALEFAVGLVTTGLLASQDRYDAAGITLASTYNYRVTNCTSNGNGTANVTIAFDVSGQFYYADNTWVDFGYVYLYINGNQVDRRYVNAGTNRSFTGTYALTAGRNEFRVDPRANTSFTGGDPAPATFAIQAPSYYGVATTQTAAAGNYFQAYYGINWCTQPIAFSATGLPPGLNIGTSSGLITGYPTSGSAGMYTANILANNGFGTDSISVAFKIENQAPSFASTTPAVVSGASEGTPFTITYAALSAALDDTDPNDDPLSFRIESMLGGTLTKNGSPITTGVSLIGPGESLVWTPPSTMNGTLDAFTVSAYDGAAYSQTTKTVRIAVGAVNDPPTLSQFSGPVASGNEDTAIAITLADLLAKGNEADIDGTVTAFVVKSITTGSLRLGASDATATAWNATTNKSISSTVNAYWTPATNANAAQFAFTAVARDDGGLESATPVQAVVTVNPLNDAPTLTSIAIISGISTSDPFEISYTTLANAANAADVDADPIAFRIEAVSAGALEKWTGSAWTAVTAGTTLIATGEKVRWTPAAGTSGLRNAFTVRAWDGQAASTAAIQVQVDGDRWRTLPWTDAASSGISTNYRYTHAYNLGVADSFSINGVSFTGLAGANPAVAGSLATTGFNAVVTNDANNLAGATRSLANDAVSTTATSASITLQGLTPGGRYVLTLFTVGRDTALRQATLSSAMGQITVDANSQGADNGLRIDYQYLADAAGSVTITLAVPSAAFSLYGLANREYLPAIGISALTSLTYNAAPKQFQAFTAVASAAPFISAGTLHSVVLKADGTVSAFGRNSHGQTDVPNDLTNVVAVSAGGSHTLALKSDGTVVAWGWSGACNVPTDLSNVVAIAGGGSHSLALKTDGTVVAWGANSGGQCNVPTGLTGVVAIAAGGSHSLALKADGTVVAWGLTWWGAGWTDYATPPNGLTDVVAISAGESHSVALRSDGTVVAWGNDGVGQSNVPTGLAGVVAISAGGSHSLALKSDGSIVAWGDRNGYGSTVIPSWLSDVVAIDAGSEHSIALRTDGSVVTFGWCRYGQQYLPTDLGPLVAISTGFSHTLAIRNGGTVVAWGDNRDQETTVPAGLTDVVAVQAGSGISIALTRDGTVVAWGARQSDLPAGLTGVTRISASSNHVLALKSNGTVVAWGDNSNGQCDVPAGLTNVVAVAAGGLGSLALKSDGTVVYWGNIGNGRGPAPAGLNGVTAIAAGWDFCLALKSDGTVVSWGNSNSDGSGGAKNMPADLSGVVAIEAGVSHSIALKSDGTMVSWGSASEVPNATRRVGVTSLAAGLNTSIALKYDGTIVGWGDNGWGRMSPPAAATFPAVGLPGRLPSFAGSFTYSYQGRGATTYAVSATPPTNAGDYTVTVTSTGSGTTLTGTRDFTIAKMTPTVSYYSRVDTIPYGTPLGSDQVGVWTPAWWNGGVYSPIPGTAIYSPTVGAVLPLGPQTLQVMFLPSDSVNFTPAIATGTITVTKGTANAASITLTPVGSLTYDGSAKSFTASATGIAGFSYSYVGRSGTVYGPSSVGPTYPGTYTVTATVNDPNYDGTKSLDFTIARATPTIIARPTASAITFTQSLANSTLSGGEANVPGSFAFAYSSREPSAGTASQDVVFTPTDTVNYTTVMTSASVTVIPLAIAADAFTFRVPSNLVYDGWQKSYSATAAGPWGTLYWMDYSYVGVGGTSYGPSATAPTNAGSYTVTATLGGDNFVGSATRSFTITKVTPAITWATPANIAYGTPLSPTQLNAAANVAGSFTYTPAVGTLLSAGANTLQATFTPTDTVNYHTVTSSVPLQVTTGSRQITLLAPPSLTYDGSAKAYVASQAASVSIGRNHSLVVTADGRVTAWGDNGYGQTAVPAGLSGVVQVSAGRYFSVALKSDGTLVGWGDRSSWQYMGTPVSYNPVVHEIAKITDATAVAAGSYSTTVLRADGTVRVLGYWNTWQFPDDLTGVTAIAPRVALKSDGSVVALGNLATVPAGLTDVVAIASSEIHALALKSDGTVVAWGYNSYGQATVPEGLSGVVAVAAGYEASYALKSDGTVIGWGASRFTNSPAQMAPRQIAAAGSNVVAISASTADTAPDYPDLLLLTADGTVTPVFDRFSGTSAVNPPDGLANVGFYAYGYSYTGRPGTIYPATSSAPTNAGDYTVTVTSTDPNYAASKTVDFTIARATPAITSLPVATSITFGQSLASAIFSGGAASVAGTFAFADTSLTPPSGSANCDVIFTPTDSNYAPVTISIPVRVRSFDPADITGLAGEAGGIANATPGFNAFGNVLTGQSNYDGGMLAVTAVVGPGGAATLGSALTGNYGTLTLGANGDYVYVVSEAASAIQALGPGATLGDSFSFTVASATDTATATLRITITGGNDAPNFSTVGAGPLKGVDEDTEAVITLADLRVAADAADVDGTVTAFAVTSLAGGMLRIGADAASALPWEATANAVIDATHNAYWTPVAHANGNLPAFAVVARDNDGLDSPTPVTIWLAVAPVNDAPTDISLDGGTVAENLPSGTTVGTLSTADVDVGDTFIYTLASGDIYTDNASFTIDGSALKATASFDFETKSSYSVLIRSADARGLFTEKAFTISVANVNEAPTDITLAGSAVAENRPAGTTVGTLATTDIDAGDTFTYTLVSGDVYADNAAFAIDGSGLTTAAPFDFETKSSYTVLIRSTDARGLFTEKAFTIAVTNVNETPTDITLTGSTVAENRPAGSAVGTLSTTDVDVGDTFTYSLVSGTGDTDNASFAIDGGTLKTAASFNFEDKTSYTVRIRSADAGNLVTEMTFTISVTNVNESPTDITLSANSVAENLPAGTIVGSLSTVDVDVGDTFTYSLVSGTVDTDNAAFTINGSTLKTADSFNFEDKTSYTVRIRSADAGNLVTEKTFTISVTNVNEPATIGLPIPFLNQVTEDVDVSGDGFLAATGQFTVTDPDTGESSFDTTVAAAAGQTNLGQLTVAADGTYIYKVLNSLTAVQALRAGETVTDAFSIRSFDGTTRVVSFRIAGASDTLAGAVADGYLRGARIFADANGDGLLDWTDAGSRNGSWDAGEGEAWTTTDNAGNFSFDFGSPTARLVTIGGTDISTGLPFLGVLQAPAGSTIINPLTTLVAATLASNTNLSVPLAAAAVAGALGLPQTLNLTTYDPLAQAAGDAAALTVQKAAAGVANVIVATATNGIDTNAALANLAGLVTAPNPGPVNLQDPTTLASVLTVQSGGQPTTPPATLVAGLVVANMAVASSQSIADVADSQKLVQVGTTFTAPAITSAATAGFATGTPGRFQFTASGYPAPTFSTATSLPAGLVLSSSGLLSGTPAAGTAGSYTFTVTATNGIAPAATQSFALTIAQSDDVTVSVDQANRVAISLAPRGVTISDLHTAYDARRRILTITVAGPGTMSGGDTGIVVDAAARTITVRLDVFTSFAGLAIMGNAGSDSITIGRQGVNLAAVRGGAASQSLSIDTGVGAADAIIVGGPVTTKAAGSASFTSLGSGAGGIRLAAPVQTLLGSQTYAGAVSLVTNAALTAGTGISFGSTVDGRRSLSLAAGGGISFSASVGATTPLTGLNVSRAASVAFAGGLGLDGTGTATASSGLTIGARVNNVVFAALGSGSRTIQNFSGSGIRFLGGSTGSDLSGLVSRRNGIGLSVAAGDYRGTRISSSTFDMSRSLGVLLDGATNLQFGGTNAGSVPRGNLISGSLFRGDASNGLLLRGNLAGTQVQGNTVRHHLGDGVILTNARGVTIGGAAAGVGNEVTENFGLGIRVSGGCVGSTATRNTVANNLHGNGEPRSLRSR